MFNLQFTGRRVTPGFGAAAVYGQIQIGEFRETFISSVVSWTTEDYERQWRTGVRQIVEGAHLSALITSYVDPPSEAGLIWWPLYRLGQTVFVRNQFLPADDVVAAFSPMEPWTCVRPRMKVNADGDEISEWETDVDSLSRWLREKQRLLKG